MTSSPDLRRKWIAYHSEYRRVWDEYHEAMARHYDTVMSYLNRGILPPPGVDKEPDLPVTEPFPDELRDMTCGAKTRAGMPCKRFDLYDNGRCKFHGGLSTGPKTLKGKKRSAKNGFKCK